MFLLKKKLLFFYIILVFLCVGKPMPNVILIQVDDLGYSDLSSYGNPYIETPNIDKLAEEGWKFSKAYAAGAICSPSRAGLITGKSPVTLGITDWIRARFQKSKKFNSVIKFKNYLLPKNIGELTPRHETIAGFLKKYGYATAHIGKWHLGDIPPQKYGFDFNAGGEDLGRPPSYYDPYKNKQIPEGILTMPPEKRGEYLTDRETREVISFIKKNQDKRFFVMLNHYAVHTPIQANKNLIEKYERKQRALGKKINGKDWKIHAAYASKVEGVDQALGKIIASLQDLNLRKNTLIIFLSDNGGLDRYTTNYPLRAGKGHSYEGGIRIPLIISHPKIEPATIDESFIATQIFDFLKLFVKDNTTSLKKDFLSLVPLKPLFWHFPHFRGNVKAPYSVFMLGDWKIIDFPLLGKKELYNLTEDPQEKRNLARQEPEILEYYSQLLNQNLADLGAKRIKSYRK